MTELGQLSVGRIRGQLHTKNPDEYLPSRQLEFLLKADALQRRLYFLWPEAHPVYCINHSLSDAESVCGCFGGCQFFDSTLEKNKYFVQLQQENGPPHAAASPNAVRSFLPRGSLKKNSVTNRDEPDCSSLLSLPNSINSQYVNRRRSLLRQRQISAVEDPLSSPTGVSHVHNTLMRLSSGANEDVIDYSSLSTLNRNSPNSLNNPNLEPKDDEKTVTASSSMESFVSAMSELPSSDAEEPPTEGAQPVVAKEIPNTWSSTVTFCPYIIPTQLVTQKETSSNGMVTILCPRYRSHLPSFLPKVSLQLPPNEVPASPVVAARVSVSVQLVEKCSVRLTSSALEFMNW